MAKVGYKFGEVVRCCEQLKKARAFAQCVDKLTGLITCLEEESKTLQRSKLVSQKELLSLAYNHRGHVFYLMVDFDAAIGDFDQAVMHNPRIAAAFYNRGLVHYRMGRFELAVKDLQEALKLNRCFEDARQCLEAAYAEIERGRREGAGDGEKPAD